MPAPPARSRSASVPCGHELDLQFPVEERRSKTLFSPTYDEIIFLTWPLARSTPSPLSVVPQLLLTMVSSLVPRSGWRRRQFPGCRTGRSHRRGWEAVAEVGDGGVGGGDALVHESFLAYAGDCVLWMFCDGIRGIDVSPLRGSGIGCGTQHLRAGLDCDAPPALASQGMFNGAGLAKDCGATHQQSQAN